MGWRIHCHPPFSEELTCCIATRIQLRERTPVVEHFFAREKHLNELFMTVDHFGSGSIKVFQMFN
jgi:hypothetical protein